MRIIRANGDLIETTEVYVKEDSITVGPIFYLTGTDTEKIVTQLLEKGYADLSSCPNRREC